MRVHAFCRLFQCPKCCHPKGLWPLDRCPCCNVEIGGSAKEKRGRAFKYPHFKQKGGLSSKGPLCHSLTKSLISSPKHYKSDNLILIRKNVCGQSLMFSSFVRPAFQRSSAVLSRPVLVARYHKQGVTTTTTTTTTTKKPPLDTGGMFEYTRERYLRVPPATLGLPKPPVVARKHWLAYRYQKLKDAFELSDAYAMHEVVLDHM